MKDWFYEDGSHFRVYEYPARMLCVQRARDGWGWAVMDASRSIVADGLEPSLISAKRAGERYPITLN